MTTDPAAVRASCDEADAVADRYFKLVGTVSNDEACRQLRKLSKVARAYLASVAPAPAVPLALRPESQQITEADVETLLRAAKGQIESGHYTGKPAPATPATGERSYIMVPLGDGMAYLQRPKPDTTADDPLRDIERAVLVQHARLAALEATVGRLREALDTVREALEVPAAEYVPAIPTAWVIIDKALAE